MFRKSILASAALALTLAPIAAQAAPAARVDAPASQADELAGRNGIGIYVIGAVVLGLHIWGVIELTDNGSDAHPHSP